MLKKLFLFALILALIVSVCLTLAAHFLKPYLKEKFLEAAEVALGRGIALAEFDISFARGILFLKGFRIDDCKYIKYRNYASADEIILDVDLPSTLFQNRLVFEEVCLKNFTFDFDNKKRPSPSLGKSQAFEDSLMPTKEISSGTEELGAKISPSKPHKQFDTIYIKRLLIEDSKFLFADYSVAPAPNIIEITDINGKIEEFSLASDGILKGYVRLKGQLNPTGGGLLKLDGSFTKGGNETDFNFDLILDDVNLIRFSPYYANTSLIILKEAKLDLDSKANCMKNALNAQQRAHIYDIELYDIKPKEDDRLFGLPAKTVIGFFKDLKGDIEFDFNVVGTIDDPKFEYGPVIQQVLIKALHDKIAAKLQELPREVIKMSEKAISENFRRIDKISIPDKNKIEDAIKDVEDGIKKIIRPKP